MATCGERFLELEACDLMFVVAFCEQSMSFHVCQGIDMCAVHQNLLAIHPVQLLLLLRVRWAAAHWTKLLPTLVLALVLLPMLLLFLLLLHARPLAHNSSQY